MKSKAKKQQQQQMEEMSRTVQAREFMIPLVNCHPAFEESLMTHLDRRMCNPTKQTLHKINDASYATRLKKQSPFEQFCDKMDKKYIILSPDSRFFLIWNILLIISILYNFFELPVSIFLTEKVYMDQFSSPLWIFINIFLMMAIFVDMVVVRPNLAYYENGQLITRRYLIVKKYTKFQVYLDAISFIVLLIYISADYRMLVYLKLLFYLKFYSLYKVDKSLINYLELHKLLYMVYIFFRITFILFFIVIWISVVYFAIDYSYYVAQDSYYDNNQLWLTDTLGGVDFIQQITWPYWLLYAAYWASEITATIGYGVGTPRNPVTVAYCCFVIVLMTVVFALFINTIWGIIGDIQESSTQYYENWASLNKILKQKQISPSLNIRVSEYFHQVWKYNDRKKNSSISESLSENLKQELVTLSHLHIFHDLPMFQRWETEFREEWIQFKIKVFELVESQELAEGEMLKADGEGENDQKLFYCVLKGRMKLKVKVADQEEKFLYNVNERFGYEEFFFQRPLTYTAHADCFTRISKINRVKFIQCLKQFQTLYFDYIHSIQRMKFTSDRLQLNEKCLFCPQLHDPFKCPTKTKWRSSLISKDPLSMNYTRMLSALDKTENLQRKTYRNFTKSEKVYNKHLCSQILIDEIMPHKSEEQKRAEVDYSEKSKFNF